MADFRDLDASDWGQVLAAGPVQFPRCPCVVSVTGPGMRRVELTLPWFSGLHDRFRAFLDAVDDAAPAGGVVDLSDAADDDDAAPEAQLCTTVYDAGHRPPSVRLNAFSSAVFFDDAGAVTHDPAGRSAAAVCALEGTWSRRGNDGRLRRGVRWKVLQVKVYAEPLPPTARPFDADADADEPPAPAAFAFLDD